MPNVFQSLVSSKRVFRELKMLCFFKHDNVSWHHLFPCHSQVQGQVNWSAIRYVQWTTRRKRGTSNKAIVGGGCNRFSCFSSQGTADVSPCWCPWWMSVEGMSVDCCLCEIAAHFARFRACPSLNWPWSYFSCFFVLQVLSALDILQPPHIDFFQEMYVNLVISYRLAWFGCASCQCLQILNVENI